MDGNSLVSSDTKSSDGVSSLGVNRSLTRELLKYLSGTSKSVTRLADGDIEGELLDTQLAHGVGGLVSLGIHVRVDVFELRIIACKHKISKTILNRVSSC